MTITIKFSHNYFKLSGDKTAKLLAVFPTHYNDLGKDFIQADTVYHTETGFGYYPLPHTDLLVLLLQDSHDLFTTVRSKVGRGGMDKEPYFRAEVGNQVNILIEEK